MSALASIIHISTAYNNEVDIRQDIGTSTNTRKVRGYVPNIQTAKALEAIVTGLQPNSTDRLHTITGAYGTGKSHFGLLLANLLAKWDEESVSEFWKKLANKFPDHAKFVQQRLDIAKKLLVVVPTHDQVSDFSRTMLRALSISLEREGINYTPNSQFKEALESLDKWTSEDYNRQKLEFLLSNEGSTASILRGKLEKYDLDAYRLWQEVFKELSGATFSPFMGASLEDAFKDTIQYLRRVHDYEGIFVIYDEFGTYLSGIAKNESASDSLQIQDFAQYCRRSGEDQCHFMIIAHQTLRDYGAGHQSAQDWNKVYGRFTGKTEISMAVSSQSEAAEELLDTVIVQRQNAEEWQALAKHADWSMLQDWCIEQKLYTQDRNWLSQVVLQGCFPLHPATVYVLPRLAEKVGQSHRTLFTFLGHEDDQSLIRFVQTESIFKNNRLNLFTLDRLFYYFEAGIQAKPEYRSYLRAHKELLQKPDAKVQRIANLLLVCEIVKQAQLQPTRDFILAALHLDAQDQNEYSRLLDYLVEKQLVRLRPTGEYGLRTQQGDISAQDAVNRFKDQLRESFVESKAVIERLKKHSALANITPNKYTNTYFVDRQVAVEIIPVQSLSNLNSYFDRINKWYQPLERGYEGDLLLVYLLATSASDITSAKAFLERGWPTSQLIIALPQVPLNIGDLLLTEKAVDAIKRDSYKLDNQAVDRDDLMALINDNRLIIEKSLDEYLDPQNFLLVKGNQEQVRVKTEGELNDYLSQTLQGIFSHTPIVHDNTITSRIAKDKTRSDRLAIIDRLLGSAGHIRISKKAGKQDERIMRFCLKDTGLFTFKRDLGLEDEFEVTDDLSSSSPLYQVWEIIRHHFELSNLQDGDPVSIGPLLSELLSPPYGLSHALIELLLAAYFRLRLDSFIVLEIPKGAVKSDDYQQREWNGQTIYEMVANPNAFIPVYFSITSEQEAYLGAIANVLIEDKNLSLNWNLVFDTLLDWLHNLPKACTYLSAYDLESVEGRFLKTLVDASNTETQPKEFLWTKLPVVLRANSSEIDQITNVLSFAIRTVEGKIENITLSATDRLCQLFNADGTTVMSFQVATTGWYNKLEFAQRQESYYNPDCFLLLQACSSDQKDVLQRFLEDLPLGMHLGAYVDWQPYRVDEFIERLTIAKSDIDTHKFSSGKGSSGEVSPNPSPNPEQVFNQIQQLVARSGLDVEQIRQILEALLESL
ncbi:MAG TPA: hypothetical protein PLQ56_07425 [Aggregatilineales bacterium]|nr:hypothetical protein [Aggregatilineales bacterium]